MSDTPEKPHGRRPEDNPKHYEVDERLREIQLESDRRMTRAEWEQEDSAARGRANKLHREIAHNKELSDKQKSHVSHHDWKKILLWTGVGIAILLLIFFIGWVPRHHREKEAAATARQREEENPQVEVTQVKRSQTPGELTVPGTTAPLLEAFIYARANGYLRRRFVDIGDHVRRGQLLALIDAPDLDQQVAQAREQLHQAEAQLAQQQSQLALNKVTWERWRTLVAKGVFSRQDGDIRETAYTSQLAVVGSAERNVESYRANLNRMIALQSYERVTAPFDGVVTQRNADVGALVGASGGASAQPAESPQTPSGGSASMAAANTSGTSGSASMGAQPNTGEAQGGALFAIAQISTLRILVSVPESYASSMQTGMQAHVFVQERPNQPITGTVARTAGSIDQNTRTLLTEVDIENRDGSLFPGMYSVVSFTQIRGEAPLVVPGDAIILRGDRNVVAAVRDEKIQFVPVEIGRDYGPVVELLSGPREGDWVVTTVTDDVQPGIKVRPHVTKQTGEGGAQNNKVPDSGPNQFGSQSVVNQSSESTNQKGKPGGQSGGQGGGQQKQQGKDSSSQSKQ